MNCDRCGRFIKNLSVKELKKITNINPKAKILFIGGDHTITQLIAPHLPVKSLLSLDAHFDLYNKWETGEKTLQTTTMRRLYEKKIKLYLRGIRSGPI